MPYSRASVPGWLSGLPCSVTRPAIASKIGLQHGARCRQPPSRYDGADVGRHCCVGISFASPGMPWLIRVKAIRAAAIGTGSFVFMT